MKKKTKREPASDDMLAEYDFSKGVRGKYAQRYAEGTNVVLLAPDVAKVFTNSDAVNAALRNLIEIADKVKTRS
jgi:urate oxidase